MTQVCGAFSYNALPSDCGGKSIALAVMFIISIAKRQNSDSKVHREQSDA